MFFSALATFVPQVGPSQLRLSAVAEFRGTGSSKVSQMKPKMLDLYLHLHGKICQKRKAGRDSWIIVVHGVVLCIILKG